jgi:hypothetical protein
MEILGFMKTVFRMSFFWIADTVKHVSGQKVEAAGSNETFALVSFVFV